MARLSIWKAVVDSALKEPTVLVPPNRRMNMQSIEYYEGSHKQVMLELNQFPQQAYFINLWSGKKVFPVEAIQAYAQNTDTILEVVYDDAGDSYYLPTLNLSNLTASPEVVELFTFDVNPETVKVDDKRIETPIRTFGGWEIQLWGDDAGIVSASGKIVNLDRDASGQLVTRITDSLGYKKFLRLRGLYAEDQAIRYASDHYRIGLMYRNDIYTGHFDDFSYGEADEPMALNYSFSITTEFRVTSARQINVGISQKLNREQSTVAQVAQWKKDQGIL